jgi:hypothetical protein
MEPLLQRPKKRRALRIDAAPAKMTAAFGRLLLAVKDVVSIAMQIAITARAT